MTMSADGGRAGSEVGFIRSGVFAAFRRAVADRVRRVGIRPGTVPPQAMPPQAMPPQAMPLQAMPLQAMPLQAMPLQVLAALDSLPYGFCLFGPDDRLVFANQGFRRIFRQPVERAPLGMHARAMIAESVACGLYAGRDPEAIWAERRAFILRRTAGSFLQSFADGRLIAISHQPQRDGGWAALYDDVTERRRAETLLHFMAHHDALTGLPNRYLFAERLDAAMAELGHGGSCALLCIDLDGFKPVNDRLGHAAGDALLRQVAERLRDGLAAGDIAARLGGDEFAVLLMGASSEAGLGQAGRIMDALGAPFPIGSPEPVCITASVGIACAPEHASGAQSLIERADTALYAAKRLRRPCVWSDPSG